MNAQNHPRIVVDPAICGGRPTVRGTHFAVADILRLLEDGDTEATLVADFPPLTRADVRACLAYAAATGLAATRGHWVDKIAGTLDEDFARGALDRPKAIPPGYYTPETLPPLSEEARKILASVADGVARLRSNGRADSTRGANGAPGIMLEDDGEPGVALSDDGLPGIDPRP
ncbi:MAG: DUF433 domain-containing protein [Allosphingosinicella sp.]